MATGKEWLAGARPRTLPNAIAPVVVGTGAALRLGHIDWWKAALALLVAVALIIGVNFANDYSDGVRGTDDDRVGPMRLVGSGAAESEAVKRAAFACFGTAAICGVALALTTAWWLIAVGAVCIAGAWFYTGGKRPYGYAGLGEVAVFIFFGLVAVLGTQFVLIREIDWAGVASAIAIGCFSSAILVVNNLRDIPGDTESGKVTLAVRLGDRRTRILYRTLIVAPLVISVVLIAVGPWALLGLLAAPLILRAQQPVRTGALGPGLIPAIGATGLAMLVWAVATAIALVLS